MLTEPALGKTFFGREEVLMTLEKRVNALKSGYRQNVALTGQMLAGKSSILYQFLYNLKDTTIIPLYIEVVEEPFHSFADKFIATLLYNYFLSCNACPEKELETLMKAAESAVPKTAHAIKRIKADLGKREYNKAYRALFNLTSSLREETGKSCVVILDEFHNLEFLKLKKPYLDFGKVIMVQKDTMYVVSSSQKNTIKKILSEKLALLYGNFEVIEISGFNDKTARTFLEKRLESTTLPAEYAEYLVSFTEGNPFYLNVIAKRISEISLKKGIYILDKDTVSDAITSVLYDTNGTVNQYFTNTVMSLMEKDLRESFMGILSALSRGANRISEIASFIGKKSKSGIAEKLKKLIELDVVFRTGSFYFIPDKVFKFWLGFVYHTKKVSLVEDVVNKTRDFKQLIEGDIDSFITENSKGSSERLRELFMNFSGELIEIAKKQRRLPKFSNVEIRKFGSRENMLAYQTEDKIWVCEIWREKGTEVDVSEFIERYRADKDLIVKRICLAPEGIDSNALLLAKENNIWVWSMNDINMIFGIYKKHNLVIK